MGYNAFNAIDIRVYLDIRVNAPVVTELALGLKMVISCRFYEQPYPEIDDVVMVRQFI